MGDASLDAVDAVFLDPLVIVAKMLRCDGDDLKDPQSLTPARGIATQPRLLLRDR